MLGLGNAPRRVSNYVPDASELHDQINSLTSYVQELAHSFGRGASRGYGNARGYASETAHDAEEVMKDNLAASMLLAVGVGVLIGYFVRRGTE